MFDFDTQLDRAQRVYDRQEPEFLDEVRDATQLSTFQVEALTDFFIKELACELDNNRFEELIDACPTDLEAALLPVLAKAYAKDSVIVDEITQGKFRRECKRLALNAWENDRI